MWIRSLAPVNSTATIDADNRCDGACGEHPSHMLEEKPGNDGDTKWKKRVVTRYCVVTNRDWPPPFRYNNNNNNNNNNTNYCLIIE